MTSIIGIRREDKNSWERRVPLTPDHVQQLVNYGLGVRVQPSPIRAFSDEQYRQAGATITDDLSACSTVFAIKEIPTTLFHPRQTYIYFAHVIKGQSHNMPMLQNLMQQQCSLIDYEKITDDQERRLVFFGRHAGIAGMVDSLWALGQRLDTEKIPNPFSGLRPTHSYKELHEVKDAISKVGDQIKAEGLAAPLVPMVVGFSGYGNVSQGAQEIFDLLPHQEISPEQLLTFKGRKSKNTVYKVVFREEHLVKPRDRHRPFELREYYEHPERYQGNFTRFVPFLTVLINGIYWTAKYPRLITLDLVKELYSQPKPPRMKVIGDISCDLGGAIECTLQCTDPSDPVYVYQVPDGQLVSGVKGNGPVVLAIDNLPCELPVEASKDFGNVLMPFVTTIARCDFGKTFEQLELPKPIKKALIVHRGDLTPAYRYLSEFIKRANPGS